MHHAYIYYGKLSLAPYLARHARGSFDFSAEHDPDVQLLTYEKFGIEEARELVRLAQLKNISGRALFVVATASMTTDAQQALLKLFEEPQEGTVFVLLTPHGSIIPTLRSRFLAYPGDIQGEEKDIEVKKFLGASIAARSAEITKLLKDEEGVRERVREFLNALEVVLYSKLCNSKENKQIREGLEDIAKVRGYVGDRAPALKMLFEHLAIALPIIK